MCIVVLYICGASVHSFSGVYFCRDHISKTQVSHKAVGEELGAESEFCAKDLH